MINRSRNGRTAERQRGYVLISAIALAVLYFALMELMMIDSQRTLREAQRFREKVIASVLADNAAELSAEKIATNSEANADYSNGEGHMKAEMLKTAGAKEGDPATFEITATGEATGVPPVSASVKLKGEITASHITIDYAYVAK